MSNPWPKSLRDVCDKWDNTSEELPSVGARCRLVLEEHEDIAAEHIERNGKEVEIIAHICNGNLAVCVCYEYWARNDVGEWWVAAFNSAAFEQIDEPFWPSAKGNDQPAPAPARPDPQLPKQVRYRDSEGGDWVDEFARTSTPEEFRGAMRFSIGKYVRRMGKKDERIKEIKKIADYANRWADYEERLTRD